MSDNNRMTEQIDKAKLRDYIDGLLQVANSQFDLNQREVLERIIRKIAPGLLDVEPMEHEKAYWAREGLIKKLRAEIDFLHELSLNQLKILIKENDGNPSLKEMLCRHADKVGDV